MRSVIATSHDTSFLNTMCTHIIDFQDRKLRMFRGERGCVLNTWVEKFPEKKGYFELKNDVVKFVFPKPGPLEGVKSKSKAIMKMAGVNFTYPTRSSPTVMDIGLQVSQVRFSVAKYVFRLFLMQLLLKYCLGILSQCM